MSSRIVRRIRLRAGGVVSTMVSSVSTSVPVIVLVVMRFIVGCPVGRSWTPQIFTHARKNLPSDFDVAGVHPGKRLGGQLGCERPQFLDQWPRCCGDMKPPRPPV